MRPLTLFFITIFYVNCTQAQSIKEKMNSRLDSKYNGYKGIALNIWNLAELGYQEEKSSKLLQDMLSSAGFKMKVGVAGIPTAFTAEYGEGYPIIGILGEFDALPGLSQTTSPFKEVKTGSEAGHACGHHLFGVASAAAAIELMETMKAQKLKGTIRFYGTPAEEGGSGKVYMVREGLFSDADVVLHWHPDSRNNANPSNSLANISAKFRFKGISAHAAGAPDRGRSALDGVEAMNHMVNLMREHVPQETRIHYVITDGGKAPNVVPDYAEVYYYARHPDREEVRSIFDRIVKAAEGAALGTDTKMEYEIIGGVYNLLENKTLAKLMHANLKAIGGVKYTQEEITYANKIQATLGMKSPPNLSVASSVDPYEEIQRKGGGSTDVGDISWVVPTVGIRTATWVPGVPAHSWQAVACGGTDMGIKGMMVAAKTIANTGYDILLNPAIIKESKTEFESNRGKDFVYKPLLGNRPPALNYRE